MRIDRCRNTVDKRHFDEPSHVDHVNGEFSPAVPDFATLADGGTRLLEEDL